MKLIRFITGFNRIEWGCVNSPDDELALMITGNVFDEFTVTNQKVRIKKVLAPVTPPDIIGIGLNYKTYAQETGIPIPEIPVMFLKASGALIGPNEPILLPKAGPNYVDFEAELAVVIGKTGKNITKENAMDHILGYTCANDISARDWQIRKQKSQWARGKSFDTFCPMGPWIVTKDEIPNPHRLTIQSYINGQVFQDSNTSDMIFDIPTIVSQLSESLTLFAGSVILTGTPHGIGFTRIPPTYLRKGDNISVFIERVGHLINPVTEEI